MTSVMTGDEIGRVEIKMIGGDVAPVGAILSEEGPRGGFRVTPAASGRFGVGLLVCYYRGRVNLVHLALRNLEVDVIRVEAHGFACRMQKAYMEVDREGRILAQGEEIISSSVKRAENGELDIRFEFVAHRTMREWLYVFATTASPDTGAFSIRRVTSTSTAKPIDSYRETAVSPTYRAGALFSVNAMYLFRNYLHVEFELYKEGTSLAALSLHSPFSLSSPQWWTAQAVRGSPPFPRGDEIMLTPRAPSIVLYSPAVMEAYGPDKGWLGHCVTALYDDLKDWRMTDVATSDSALSSLVFHARFEDGTEVAFPVVGDPPSREAAEISELKEIGRSFAGRERPILLEIGCRGPHSIRMRAELTSLFDYVGLDMFDGPNVDVVGDAHALTRTIDCDSVDVVYANSVIEHLANPMRFILEANKVLKTGGVISLNAPTTWALHAEPWDFWRFNVHTWPTLLNPETGFEIVSTREIGEACIVPTLPALSAMTRMQYAPAPLSTRVVARKTATSSLVWPESKPIIPEGRYDP